MTKTEEQEQIDQLVKELNDFAEVISHLWNRHFPNLPTDDMPEEEWNLRYRKQIESIGLMQAFIDALTLTLPMEDIVEIRANATTHFQVYYQMFLAKRKAEQAKTQKLMETIMRDLLTLDEEKPRPN